MNETPVQNSPATPTDTARASGGIVRTAAIVGETRDDCPLPTRADTVRTPSASEGPDTDPVVRFAYRTTAPRHLAGAAFAAFAEALSRVTAKLHPEPEPEPAPPKATRCCLCGDIGDYENYNGDLFCWPCVNGEPVDRGGRGRRRHLTTEHG